MIISEQFLKSIPIGKKEFIFNKLIKFEEQLLKYENKIRELPAGYWVRAIKNTEIFKFRLNNKDRLLFTYINKRDDIRGNCSDILFLSYVNHDEQIRVGKNINLNNVMDKTMEINSGGYVEDDTDGIIDETIINTFDYGKVDMNKLPSIVVNAHELSLLSDELNKDYIYYLSDEQYNVIKALDNPVLLSGAGGTGKTVVLVNALALASENKEKSIYISYNKLLVENISTLYSKFIDKNTDELNCDFYSLKELEQELVEGKQNTIITNLEMIKWIGENIRDYKFLKHKDLYEVATEIKGVIKGYLGLEYSEVEEIKSNAITKLSLEKYLNIPKQYSSFNEEEKRDVYKITEFYDKWLCENNVFDENDVARQIISTGSFKKYDWVIVDEVQDLSEAQIYMITNLVKEHGHIIWAGDINQTINPTFFNYGRVKNLYYSRDSKINTFTLTNNYRTSDEIITLINEITNTKVNLIGKSKYDSFETAIKKGDKPLLLNFDKTKLNQLMEDIKEKHYCAVVVANEEEKETLLKEFPMIEGRLFVVHEIKGLEYENIICYNILSTYNEIWKSILSGECKHNDKFRYYFNLLYVSISRAKDRLSIYEKNMDDINFKPFNMCLELEEYNSEILGISKESTKKDWEQEADRLEKIGQVEKSNFIRNNKLEENVELINRGIDERAKTMYQEVSTVVDISDNIDKEIEPGIIEYRKRNYTGALDIFNKALQQYPAESKIYYYLGNTYGYMTGSMGYSLKFFKKAIELNPYEYEYYLDMAAILKAMRRYDDAIKVLDLAHKVIPNLGNAKEMQAGIYNDMGKFEKAKSAFVISNKYPKYSFDSFNKAWRKVEAKAEVINNKTVRVNKDNVSKLPKGLEYIKVVNDGSFSQCTSDIKFISTSYNKKNKRYTIEFDIELCSLCESFNECIASRADNKNKVSIKQISIKQLLKMKEEANEEQVKHEAVDENHKNYDYIVNTIQSVEHNETIDNDYFIDDMQSQFSGDVGSLMKELKDIFNNV